MKMTSEQKLTAMRLTSLFENAHIEFQYDYAENLHDGRGITCGRIGFCTGTGDAHVVVKRYHKLKPGNPLSKYVDEMKRLNIADDRADTRGLKRYEKAWRQASRDATFRQIQDDVTDEIYWTPSQKYCDILGLKTPLARAFIYDTIIQHGDDGDPDGLTALLIRANALVGGTPRTGIDEKEWLTALIRVRRADLSYCSEASSRRVWAQSTGRCDVFSGIAATGNYELKTPFKVRSDGQWYTIP